MQQRLLAPVPPPFRLRWVAREASWVRAGRLLAECVSATVCVAAAGARSPLQERHHRLLAPCDGVLVRRSFPNGVVAGAAAERMEGAVVLGELEPQPCPHAWSIDGLCADCGTTIDSGPRSTISDGGKAAASAIAADAAAVMGPALAAAGPEKNLPFFTNLALTGAALGGRVTLNDAVIRAFEKDKVKQLLTTRKLPLVLDLDNTLVHAHPNFIDFPAAEVVRILPDYEVLTLDSPKLRAATLTARRSSSEFSHPLQPPRKQQRISRNSTVSTAPTEAEPKRPECHGVDSFPPGATAALVASETHATLSQPTSQPAFPAGDFMPNAAPISTGPVENEIPTTNNVNPTTSPNCSSQPIPSASAACVKAVGGSSVLQSLLSPSQDDNTDTSERKAPQIVFPNVNQVTILKEVFLNDKNQWIDVTEIREKPGWPHYRPETEDRPTVEPSAADSSPRRGESISPSPTSPSKTPTAKTTKTAPTAAAAKGEGTSPLAIVERRFERSCIRMIHYRADAELLGTAGSAYAQNHEGYYCALKVRPGVLRFLREASKLFELYLFTAGTALHAAASLLVLDPQRQFFQDRVFSREHLSLTAGGWGPKSVARLFPASLRRAVLVVDDSPEVWATEEDATLLQCHAYHFWADLRMHPALLAQLRDTNGLRRLAEPPGVFGRARAAAAALTHFTDTMMLKATLRGKEIMAVPRPTLDGGFSQLLRSGVPEREMSSGNNHEADGNGHLAAAEKSATSGAEEKRLTYKAPAVLEDSDFQLTCLLDLLKFLHEEFFQRCGSPEDEVCLPPMKAIYSAYRRQVLKGFVFQTTGLRDCFCRDFAKTDIGIAASAMGARFVQSGERATHMLVGRYTAKYHAASQQQQLTPVHLMWLEAVVFSQRLLPIKWFAPDLCEDKRHFWDIFLQYKLPPFERPVSLEVVDETMELPQAACLTAPQEAVVDVAANDPPSESASPLDEAEVDDKILEDFLDF